MTSKLGTFRTDSETWDSFQAKAKLNGTNASSLLQGFIRNYLDGNVTYPADSDIKKAEYVTQAELALFIETRLKSFKNEVLGELAASVAKKEKRLG
jgi:hypothetical protein